MFDLIHKSCNKYKNIVLHSSIKDLRNSPLTPRQYLDLPEYLASKGFYVFLPSFTFDLPKPINFSPHKTPPNRSMGSLPNHIFKLYQNQTLPIIRTLTPIHSYLIYGPTRHQELATRTWTSSTGSDSIFSYLRKEPTIWINLGCRFGKGAYSFIHHAESIMGVPYRQDVQIPYTIDNSPILQTIKYYAKRAHLDFDRSPLYNSTHYTSEAIMDFRTSGYWLVAHEYQTILNITLDCISKNPYSFYPDALLIQNS